MYDIDLPAPELMEDGWAERVSDSVLGKLRRLYARVSQDLKRIVVCGERIMRRNHNCVAVFFLDNPGVVQNSIGNTVYYRRKRVIHQADIDLFRHDFSLSPKRSISYPHSLFYI